MGIEIFKTANIPGDKYEISNTGLLRNKKTGRMLRFDYSCEYARFSNKQLGHYLIHRLVAEAFLPNPLCLPEINHKNEFDKTDNFVYINEDGTVDPKKSSIEWCNREYNCNYGTRNKRIGDKNGKPIIQKTLNGIPVFIWKSASEAEICGFNKYDIYSCLSGKRKSHKGFTFERF